MLYYEKKYVSRGIVMKRFLTIILSIALMLSLCVSPAVSAEGLGVDWKSLFLFFRRGNDFIFDKGKVESRDHVQGQHGGEGETAHHPHTAGGTEF